MIASGASLPFIAPADSARAVATVYTASLVAMVPVLVAAVALLLIKRTSAEGRVLVWRSALVALLLVFVGRLLPTHWVAWVVPSALATPLVALGRVQVTAAPDGVYHVSSLVSMTLLVYLVGVAAVALQTLVASLRLRRIARRATPLAGSWRAMLNEVQWSIGLRGDATLVVSDHVAVPMTWGARTPIVVMPRSAMTWTVEQRRMALVHELCHVRAGDWLFGMLTRVVCALYWFNPGAWWMARGLREDCELLCDQRVIASGVRRSEYAELLIGAADDLAAFGPSFALARRNGLRARLASILDSSRDVTPMRRQWVVVAALGAVLVSAPTSAVQLAPTRAVLTTLMRDARWESRAYAVIGLANRADSIAQAREAAEQDPSPRVRAWARYALRQRGDTAELRVLLNQ